MSWHTGKVLGVEALRVVVAAVVALLVVLGEPQCGEAVRGALRQFGL